MGQQGKREIVSRATVKRAVAGALSVGLLGGLGLGIAPGAMAAGENITFIQGVKQGS